MVRRRQQRRRSDSYGLMKNFKIDQLIFQLKYDPATGFTRNGCDWRAVLIALISLNTELNWRIKNIIINTIHYTDEKKDIERSR